MTEPLVHFTESYYGECDHHKVPIETFIDDNLGKHLEERVKRLQALIVPLVKAALLNGSMDIEQVAYLIDANGHDFVLAKPE